MNYEEWRKQKEADERSASRYAGGGGAPDPRFSQLDEVDKYNLYLDAVEARYDPEEPELYDPEEIEEEAWGPIGQRRAWIAAVAIVALILFVLAWFTFLVIRDSNGGLQRYPQTTEQGQPCVWDPDSTINVWSTVPSEFPNCEDV